MTDEEFAASVRGTVERFIRVAVLRERQACLAIVKNALGVPTKGSKGDVIIRQIEGRP
jgi:hypothetical protein